MASQNVQPDPCIRHSIEAERAIEFGSLQIVRKQWDRPIDVSASGDSHHLELSLLPRSETAAGCFVEDWGPDRFEPIGAVFLIPADKVVRARSNCRHQNSIVCHLNPDAVERWFEKKIEWTDGRLRGALDITNLRVRNLLFRMGEEVRQPGFASDNMIELMAAEAVIELSRYFTGIEERLSGGLAAWRLRLIDERLTDDYAAPSLTELADLCNISVRQLTRSFRVSRGRSIGKYIAEHRIDHAKQMLASGMSVKAVAYTTGYSAPSNFTAAFVRATGETPRDYQQRVSAKAAAAVSRSSNYH